MPVIPFITDTPHVLAKTIQHAHAAGVDFIIYGGMTLKEGRQKEHFDRVLMEHFPHLSEEYTMLYTGDRWGQITNPDYYHNGNILFDAIIRKYGIPKRIPPRFFRPVLGENDLVAVILGQMDYLLKSMGRSSPYGYAAHTIATMTTPLFFQRNNLRDLKGVGTTTAKFITEILETGTCSYYERLLKYDV